MTALALTTAGCLSSASTPSASPANERPSAIAAVGGVLVEYDEPAGWHPVAESRERVLGIADGVPGLSYGFANGGGRTNTPHRGIVVADITGANHHLDQRPVGLDAAAFFESTAEVTRQSGDHAYHVDEIGRADVAGFPALAADVRPAAGVFYPFLEMGDDSHVVNLGVAQRLIAVDVGDSLILVQIWATDRHALTAWIPAAKTFIQGLRLAPRR